MEDRLLIPGGCWRGATAKPCIALLLPGTLAACTDTQQRSNVRCGLVPHVRDGSWTASWSVGMRCTTAGTRKTLRAVRACSRCCTACMHACISSRAGGLGEQLMEKHAVSASLGKPSKSSPNCHVPRPAHGSQGGQDTRAWASASRQPSAFAAWFSFLLYFFFPFSFVRSLRSRGCFFFHVGPRVL